MVRAWKPQSNQRSFYHSIPSSSVKCEHQSIGVSKINSMARSRHSQYWGDDVNMEDVKHPSVSRQQRSVDLSVGAEAQAFDQYSIQQSLNGNILLFVLLSWRYRHKSRKAPRNISIASSYHVGHRCVDVTIEATGSPVVSQWPSLIEFCMKVIVSA